MSFWLEYETPLCLHEQDSSVIQEFHVVMPRLSHGESRWEIAYVQKYEKDGKILWRSLDRRRNVFSRGHKTREEAAQKVVAESPICRSAIAGRRRTLALRKRGQEPWYHPWDCPPKR